MQLGKGTSGGKKKPVGKKSEGVANLRTVLTIQICWVLFWWVVSEGGGRRRIRHPQGGKRVGSADPTKGVKKAVTRDGPGDHRRPTKRAKLG